MHKTVADTLAINMAVQIMKSDPNFLAASAADHVKAKLVADFIKDLSARLQEDIADEVNPEQIMLR